MAIDFTDDQKGVINSRHNNLLVSAAAGSGKTAVLVERIVSLVCDENNKIDIDQLLVVTFTKAAAAEMRERVHKRIALKLSENPADKHLQKQYSLVHRAMITTIDAFCQSVLRNHFHDIGLDPDFRVMDEGEAQLMRRDVLRNLFEEKYEAEDPGFIEASVFFAPTRSDDSEFEETVLELQNYSESFAWPERFLEERKEDHKDTYELLTGIDEESGKPHPLGEFFYKYLIGKIKGAEREYEKFLDICNMPGGPTPYAGTIEKELDLIRSVLKKDTVIDLGEALRHAVDDFASRVPGCKGDGYDESLKNMVKDGRGPIKKELTAIAKLFTPTLKKTCETSDACAPYMDTLIDITIEFRRRFLEKKAEEHVVDFGDLEHFALDILVDAEGNPTQVAQEYRDHFKEIMVDEYQDSNLVQDVILDAIASKEAGSFDRFMVGDVKQSIYSFRQARPDLFLEKYNTYRTTEGCDRKDLSKNFRSREEVLSSVNEVFERIMHEETGGIEYDSDARLYTGAEYPEGDPGEFKTRLLLFDKKFSDIEEVEEDGEENANREDNGTGDDKASDTDNGSDADSDDEDYTSEESEALVLANAVRELLNTRVTEKRTDENGREESFFRKAKYSDIVILHRSPGKIAGTIGRIFEKEGIPISISQGGGYFSAPEIRAVVQLLRTINNPLDEIPLYGVLVSVFGEYTPEEVANLRAKHPGKILWEAVMEEAPGFAEKINRYRYLSTYRTVRELLQIIYDEHDYPEYVSALPAGAKRKGNALMLLSYAAAYEQTSYYGVYHFVRYLDQLEKYTEDKTSEADVLGETADVVRLMTIHKSKGLEFPIVILAGMGKGFNLSDTTSKLVHDNELGLGQIFVDTERRLKCSTLRHDLIAKKITESSVSEEQRLLYVAMTRAKERLVMVGRCKDVRKTYGKIKSSGETILGYNAFVSSRSYLDMISPVLNGCGSIDVRVISSKDIRILGIQEQLELSGRKAALKDALSKADAEELEKIRERFAYEYPFKNLEGLYTKTTVSEFKMAAMLDEDEAAYEQFESREKEVYIPKFRRGEEGISGTVRGNSYHRVMEIMDFDRTLGRLLGGRPGSLEEFNEKISKTSDLSSVIGDFISEELRERRITKECSEAVNARKIEKFLSSALAYRMWTCAASGSLKREQPFVLSLPAKRIDKEFPEGEKVLIQGIIDAYFVEEDGIVLLDYKTDSVKSGEELVNRYTAQLDYYQEAIEKLTGMKVKERILYSFSLGEEVKC